MNKKMRKVNSVLDEVEQYRMKMKRRRDFSFLSTPVDDQDGKLENHKTTSSQLSSFSITHCPDEKTGPYRWGYVEAILGIWKVWSFEKIGKVFSWFFWVQFFFDENI